MLSGRARIGRPEMEAVRFAQYLIEHIDELESELAILTTHEDFR